MGIWILVIALFLTVAVFAVSFDRTKKLRSSRSQTTALIANASTCRRELVDGRVEEVSWSNVTEIEVVVSENETPDGATAFLLIAESSTKGVLVPLGVGLDEPVWSPLDALSPSLVASIRSAASQALPARRTVWMRPGTSGAYVN